MAADVSVGFMFGNQGQVCEAPTRLLVQRRIRDDFAEEVLKRTRALKVGNPLDLQVDLGPIVAIRPGVRKFLPAWSERKPRAFASRSTVATPRFRDWAFIWPQA